jgi:hypothetical protein
MSGNRPFFTPDDIANREGYFPSECRTPFVALTLIECRRRRRPRYLPRTARAWFALNLALWGALAWVVLWR